MGLIALPCVCPWESKNKSKNVHISVKSCLNKSVITGIKKIAGCKLKYHFKAEIPI
jgi:hypothetical protein